MYDNIKIFTGNNPDVKKYVFESKEVCVEAVLYKYESYKKRTVLCISTQCGCPVGCTFCGTGKNFIRNLMVHEIVTQVTHIITEIEKEENIESLNSICEKFQIMLMSMGEPFLNYDNVQRAIRILSEKYCYAQILVSTMGVKNNTYIEDFIRLSKNVYQVGLQFSVHSGFDSERNKIIPFVNKLNLREIRDFGIAWNKVTERPVYLNFCVDSFNMNADEIHEIKNLFSPLIFNLTFSVICENVEGEIKHELLSNHIEQKISDIMQNFIKDGYNVRMFDPSGQEIGGGCGQLFYVQKWMKENKNK